MKVCSANMTCVWLSVCYHQTLMNPAKVSSNMAGKSQQWRFIAGKKHDMCMAIQILPQRHSDVAVQALVTGSQSLPESGGSRPGHAVLQIPPFFSVKWNRWKIIPQCGAPYLAKLVWNYKLSMVFGIHNSNIYIYINKYYITDEIYYISLVNAGQRVINQRITGTTL